MPKTMKKELLQLKKIIHPRSRKTKQLTKQLHKSSTREKSKLFHHVKQNLLGEKLLWFRDNLDPGKFRYTPGQMIELIEKYLARFSEELEQIRLKHSVGCRSKHRQHASREDIIRLTVITEQEEFATCGLELPDLLNVKQFELLKNWSGELRYLQNFKLKRYCRSDLQALPRKHAPHGTAATGQSEDSAKVLDKNDEEMCDASKSVDLMIGETSMDSTENKN